MNGWIYEGLLADMRDSRDLCVYGGFYAFLGVVMRDLGDGAVFRTARVWVCVFSRDLRRRRSLG